MAKARCFHCGRPATLLCDYILGFEKAGTQQIPGYPPHDVIDDDSEMFTCDRPLCDRCATNKGHTFYCGKGGWIQSHDYCRGHAQEGGHEGLRILTRPEAEAMQKQLMAKIYRP